MGAVETTYTFSSTDTITSDKLNNIIDDTVITSTAILGTTLEVASGKLKVRSAGITSNELSANSVTTNAIADSNVTPLKFSLGRINWNDWTTDGSKMSTTILAYGRTTSQAGATNLDFRASDAVINTSYDARISRESGAVGALSIDNVYDPADTTTVTRGQIDLKINGSVKLSIRQDGAIITNGIPTYGIRSFVKINGFVALSSITGSATRNSSGVVTCINMNNHGFITNDVIYIDFASGILSGIYKIAYIDANSFSLITTATTVITTPVAAVITKRTFAGSNIKAVTGGKISGNGVGFYAVSFNDPMPSADYSFVGTCSNPASTVNTHGYTLISIGEGLGYNAKTTNGFAFTSYNTVYGIMDSREINIQVAG